MARYAGKVIPTLIILVLLAAAAATARPISSPGSPAVHSPCGGMMTDHATFHPSTTADGAAAATDRVAVLGRKYGPLVFVSLPKGDLVPPSAPINNGNSVKN